MGRSFSFYPFSKLLNDLIILNNIILLGFSILVFNFLKFHIKLMASNLTTIETLDKTLDKSVNNSNTPNQKMYQIEKI